MFHSYFERKYDKVLTFNIVYFPNFEISASLLLAPPSNKFWIFNSMNFTFLFIDHLNFLLIQR